MPGVHSTALVRPYWAKLNQKAAQAFAQPYAPLLALLPQQVPLNADETGPKENGHRYWTWCFRGKDCLAFEIHAARGSDGLFDLLGQNFQGSLGADLGGAYRKYARQCGVLIQFCRAHLIREVKYPQGKVHRLIENLSHRFCLHGEGYFHFITHPEIQPTNNSVEQTMRFVVMDRHMTQGTRSQ